MVVTDHSKNNYFLQHLDHKSEWRLPEIPRGSAALTGATGDGGAVSGVVREKAVLDDPIPDMAVRPTDTLLSYHCVPSVQKHLIPGTYRNRHTCLTYNPTYPTYHLTTEHTE